jgi:ribose transport system ATP-binding protein
MSVMDNLFLGVERIQLGLLSRARQWIEAAAALGRVGLGDLDPAQRISTLPLPVRQLVEIAKALLRQAHVLIMDEPTSALPGPDAERLFGLIAELTTQRHQPASIIYITHRMEEIYRLADRITVLRDGHHVITSSARELPREDLVRAIVGRDVHRATPPATQAVGDNLLEVEGITVAGQRGPAGRDISFALHAGEVIGLAGLQGSGAGPLLHALFGDRRIIAGQLRIRGEPVHLNAPRDAMARGIALLTDDRATLGLCRDLSVSANLTLACLPALSPQGLRRPGRERSAANRAIDSFRIRCRSHRQSVRTLSGGNQQKVALGKWLLRQPRILLLNDPTRGVDIAARQEIYTLIGRVAAAGAGILLASTDLDELLELSDRIIVLHRGKMSGTFDRGSASRERVMAAAMGGGTEEMKM